MRRALLAAACSFLIPAFALAASPAAASRVAEVPRAAQPVVVPLMANGTEREPVRVLVDGDNVWMAVEDLQAAGMLAEHVPGDRVRTLRGRGYLNLAECADLLAFRFDLADLTLQLDLQPKVMALNSVDLRARGRTNGRGRAASAYINYSFTGGTGTSPSMFLEAVGSAAAG
ncbi:MAG: hypothetical protein EOO24_17120, partial [Comamonadaceae bacterium]